MDRYSSSFLIGWWLFVLSYAFQNDSLEIPVVNIKSTNALVSIILIIFLVKIPMANYLHLPYAPEPQRFEIARIYKAVKSEFTSNNDKVYIVWNGDTSKGLNHLVLKYFPHTHPIQ